MMAVDKIYVWYIYYYSHAVKINKVMCCYLIFPQFWCQGIIKGSVISRFFRIIWLLVLHKLYLETNQGAHFVTKLFSVDWVSLLVCEFAALSLPADTLCFLYF